MSWGWGDRFGALAGRGLGGAQDGTHLDRGSALGGRDRDCRAGRDG